jgi:hypothetical protein
MNKLIPLIASLASLQGCMSYTELAKKNCTEYGFSKGTSAMAQCIQTEARASQKSLTNALKGLTHQNNRGIQTDCTSWGNTINCTTY